MKIATNRHGFSKCGEFGAMWRKSPQVITLVYGPPHLASRDPLDHHLHPLLHGPEHDGVHGPQDPTPVEDDAWITEIKTLREGYQKKHRENREKLPCKHFIGCRGVELFLLNDVTITTSAA